MSYYLTFLPLFFNAVLSLSNAFEHNWGKALYWLGATILTVGIMKMEG